ncbi:mechanosensitive ion channel family protein [Agrobacterium tumefaciens]|uniref:mechanosensitive ion channel family protein n=1 Tax=Agrobacterium tumefaciens TaxID=358 RepID=UPI0015724E88|nr:mechanosensitive ion channel family protein [Agrobacterium tumefaciens]NSX90758.1 mechanosensitive ion channel family protein [Agrobacterium tumefaciens]UXT48952.1 mechanosensitive ion channel family protein [Agrobacterium tumefaciens]
MDVRLMFGGLMYGGRVLGERRGAWRRDGAVAAVLLAGFSLLCAFLLSTMPVSAQDGANPAPVVIQASTVEQARTDLDKWKSDVAAIAGQVEAGGSDDVQLVDLKGRADGIAADAAASNTKLRTRLDQIKTRLEALGEPPAEGQPPEASMVTEERARLTAERAEVNAIAGEVESISTNAAQISNNITAIRRALFAATLFKRTEISAQTLGDASSAFVTELTNLNNAFSSWAGFVWNYKRLPMFGAVTLSIMAALLFLVGGYRFFGSRMDRRAFTGEPSYLRRLSVAFWSTMVQSLSLLLFLVTSAFFLDNFNVLRSDIAPILFGAMAITGFVYFVSRLSYAIFAPTQPEWRLLQVSNKGAHTLSSAVLLMALVNGLDYLFGTISETLYSPLIVTVAKSFVASIIIGIILLTVSFLRPVIGEGQDYDTGNQRLPRWLVILLRVGGLILIGACLTGYVGLARFLATQIVATGAVLATMYIGILSGKAISRQGAFAESLAGRYFARRFGLGVVALDQAGLAAGLGIYAVALAFGVPLILFSWGFQPGDIESWAYRLLTGITVGNASISLIGLFGGVLVFAIGYIITRWFQRWLDNNVMARGQVDAGVRNSVKTGIGYLGIAVAAIFGVSSAGLNLSSLALVASALSVGIGFGLQNIVSNFVSGLILLVERPFKVGDWVVTGTTEGTVKRLSVRATEIETFRGQSIIVPNSEFVNSSVGNWTHRNRIMRAEIPVSVAYDSDPQQVMDILLELVRAQPPVLRNPEPHVEFLRFGDFSLDFELRFHLADLSNGLGVKNALRIAILQRFRDEGIAIPFPQRNLNIHVEGDANPQMLAALLSEEGDKAVVAHTGAAAPEKEALKGEKPTEPKEKPGAKA